ncbi:MAG: hypothetical protein ACYC61_19185, partial [Isosphaeraceae bacterium]
MEETVAPIGANASGPYRRFFSGDVGALGVICSRNEELMRGIAAEYMQGQPELGGRFEPADFLQETFRRLIESPAERALPTEGECEREFWR